MIIYKDIVTESRDELLADSFDITEVDGVLYEVNCSMVEIGAVNVDTDENGDGLQTVNSIVHGFRLQPISFDNRASYQAISKLSAGYMKKVITSLKKRNTPGEEVSAFKKGAAAQSKRILDNFENWEFYIGESMDSDGMVVLLGYREDGITPFVMYWKHGLEEMEV